MLFHHPFNHPKNGLKIHFSQPNYTLHSRANNLKNQIPRQSQNAAHR